MHVEVKLGGASDKVAQLVEGEVAPLVDACLRIFQQLYQIDTVEVQEKIEEQLLILLGKLFLTLLPHVLDAHPGLRVLQVNLRQAGYHAIVIGHLP